MEHNAAFPISFYLLPALELLGGLAAFLFGMELLTSGVQRLFNPTSQIGLRRLTKRPLLAFLEGVGAASIIHSGPVVVTAVAFINAGIITYVQSLPLLLGANVGTSISMQVMSIPVGELAFVALFLGVLMRRLSRREGVVLMGSVVTGLALLFFGLGAMREACVHIRDTGLPERALAAIAGNPVSAFVMKFLAGLVFAAAFQSSGAAIAIVFSLAGQGGLARVEDALPMLCGAHVGGALVALWASAGATPAGRRASHAHILFNAMGTLIALVALPAYAALARSLSDDPMRQVAHLNTIIHVGTALVLLPVCRPLAGWVESRIPLPVGEDEQSHLDPEFIAHPDVALHAAGEELLRQGNVTRRMMHRALDTVVTLEDSNLTAIARDEDTVDTINIQLRAYLHLLAERAMTREQSMMLQTLRAASEDFERIADHTKGLMYLTRQKKRRRLWFSDEAMLPLLELGRLVSEMLDHTVATLRMRESRAGTEKSEALELRREYKRLSAKLRCDLREGLLPESKNAVAMLHFLEYIAIMDRMVRHMRFVAREELGAHLAERGAPEDREAEIIEPQIGPPPGHVGDPSFEEALRKAKARGVPP